MSRDLPHLFMLRFAAEMATKARGTRRRFQDRLAKNLRDALESAGVEYRVEPRWSRIYVEASDSSALGALSSVFGISSISVIDARLPADLDEIVRVGRELYEERVRGRKYAVETRRVGDHDFSSRDVKVELGAALNRDAEVDLDDPDVTVSVEIREDEAFLYSGRIEGAGGLPLGVEGSAVCLVSGGFDSAVAAWLMLRRGIALDYVFCNLGGDAYERSVLSVAKVLADDWSYGERPAVHVVDFGDVVDALKESVTPRYWQVVLKRLMYRTGEAVARETGAEAIVTGESVGQVSSQTLTNLRAIDDVADLPVLRPLVGYDKPEIIRRAERVGTSSLSARIREYCAILPDKPVTHSSPEAAADEESKVDGEVVERAVAERKVLDLRSLDPVDLVRPYIFTREIPDDAVVFDCREPHHYRAWHYPGAEQRGLDDLAEGFRRLDKERSYVLYCNHGVQTAHLAEEMQREGYEAYSFEGGVRRLMRYAEEEGAAAGAVL